MVRRPLQPMTSTPPATELNTEWDYLQEDAILLPDTSAIELLKAQLGRMELKNREKPEGWTEKGMRALDYTWGATMDFTGRARDRMTVAEMMRQVAKG
jgi:hypothetical protein